MKYVNLRAYGGPENLEILEAASLGAPQNDQLLVQVEAAGLNGADLMQRKGHYPPPPGESAILGLEISGTVQAMGPHAKKFKVGDRVMCLLAGGGYSEELLVSEKLAMPIPELLSFTEAAAIPEVWLTAWLELKWLANIQSGESLLVHAAASGVGTAAIQIAKAYGLRVLATASAGKHEELKKMGQSDVYDYASGDFSEWVLAQSAGLGVHTILDLVGAAHWAGNLRALRKDGTLLVVGLGGGAKVELDLRQLITKRIRVIGSNLRARSLEEKGRLIEDFTREALPKFSASAGRFYPVVDRVYPLAEVRHAHERLEAKAAVGKVILSFR